jgi:quercetin dioxygenase-like cupin family protein
MQTWNLRELEAPAGARDPVVLTSGPEGRAVMIRLDPGQELGDHQVKEYAFVVVLEGTVRLGSDERTVEAGAGTLALFAPDERHAISCEESARLLLVLSPWPGEGHYRGGDSPAGAA